MAHFSQSITIEAVDVLPAPLLRKVSHRDSHSQFLRDPVIDISPLLARRTRKIIDFQFEGARGMRKEFEIDSSLQRLVAWWNGISQMKIWERIDGDYGNVQRRMFEGNLSFNSCLRRFRAQPVIGLRFKLKKGDFYWNVIGRSQRNFMHADRESNTCKWQLTNNVILRKFQSQCWSIIKQYQDENFQINIEWNWFVWGYQTFQERTKGCCKPKSRDKNFLYGALKYVVANSNLSVKLAQCSLNDSCISSDKIELKIRRYRSLRLVI